MVQAGATQERPNLPKRLESIEELLTNVHATVSRMRPSEEEKKEAVVPGPVGGIEASAARIEHSLTDLHHRLAGVADTVGQL